MCLDICNLIRSQTTRCTIDFQFRTLAIIVQKYKPYTLEFGRIFAHRAKKISWKAMIEMPSKNECVLGLSKRYMYSQYLVEINTKNPIYSRFVFCIFIKYFISFRFYFFEFPSDLAIPLTDVLLYFFYSLWYQYYTFSSLIFIGYDVKHIRSMSNVNVNYNYLPVVNVLSAE